MSVNNEVFSDKKDSDDLMGHLNVEVKFPVGTSRERLMELLADVLYKPDVVLSDPMPSEEHDWETIEHDNVSFCYESNISVKEQNEGSLTYEKMKSLYLHKAVIDELWKNKDRVISVARENIEQGKNVHRSDGMSVKYLNEWSKVLDGGIHKVTKVLKSVDEYSCDLRQNSPFAGVLSDSERLELLSEFKEYWAKNYGKKDD